MAGTFCFFFAWLISAKKFRLFVSVFCVVGVIAIFFLIQRVAFVKHGNEMAADAHGVVQLLDDGESGIVLYHITINGKPGIGWCDSDGCYTVQIVQPNQ
ncbi:hypothetical protein C5B42_05050 [Candidatus Cerribacteria bacterium 'Amazon FNV 2010 28 9']|uniref:Uncharacterized protein n=1 Tax=Candidatus Cerribacteria bacterium 'Amazon FNV 2010 28 9' TaxID=2081795 RepID=A0A317JNR8_9BACT|nr:MAG: hypothetical protein C5B42_05050 [Candidatus Cerribacteria bacterium 'Amazon FNV 2010 28 9']